MLLFQMCRLQIYISMPYIHSFFIMFILIFAIIRSQRACLGEITKSIEVSGPADIRFLNHIRPVHNADLQ